jgi:hypothetical protein
MSNPLDEELKALNAKVSEAIAERKAWMDAHMKDYAKWQIGEVLYNMETGQKMGTVSHHYRYSAEHQPFYDTSMSIDYTLETSPGCFDNTSRHAGGIRFENLKQLQRERQSEADCLKRQMESMHLLG